MKWLALLGGVFLLVVWLVLREAPQAPAPAVRNVLPPPAAPASPPPAVAVVGAPAVVLRGVVYRGPGSDQSQALLSVSGRPAQMFRAGEAVDQGWTLETIAQDHAIISKEGNKTRLAIVSEPGAAGLSVAGGASAAKDTPLPGFSRASAPLVMPSTEKSHEENQRFLKNRANRMSGASAPR